MANVRSKWTNNAVTPGAMLPAAEWADAAVLPIPAGFMMVKNDADNLYVILDMVGDNGNDPGNSRGKLGCSSQQIYRFHACKLLSPVPCWDC